LSHADLIDAFGPGTEENYRPTRTRAPPVPDIKTDPIVLIEDAQHSATDEHDSKSVTDTAILSQREYEDTDDTLRLFNDIQQEYQ
jgi:hypothetical protein